MFFAKTVSNMTINRTSVPMMPMGTGLRSRNGFMSARAHRVVVVDVDGVEHRLLAALQGVVVGELAVRLAEEEVEPRAVGRGPRCGVHPLREVLELLGQVPLLLGQLLGEAAEVVD